MTSETPDTHQKALKINLDPRLYGTIAEIGAGQEVARWFFRVGGASGTVAKTMSAYDMTFSDAIYGPSERYVSRQRLITMLGYEYRLLQERLQGKRDPATQFFVFADTVAASSYSRPGEGRGWMGVRFQREAGAAPSQIIIHLRILDKENVQQQEALGIVGVNLVYGAYFLHQEPYDLIRSLVDDLSIDRVAVNLIHFSGPAFGGVDNRLMLLHLVTSGLTHAVICGADGDPAHPAELLYNKAILVERGRFRPVTNVSLDMLACAQTRFAKDPKVAGEPIEVLMEMTVNNLLESGEDGTIDHGDFLNRVDLLAALGKPVLISNYDAYHRLAAHLFQYTKKMIGLVMGVPTLKEIFDEKYYQDLEGGILESFGRLFRNDLKLYVYPYRDPATGTVVSADNIKVASHLRHLYAYLLDNRYIESLRDYDERLLSVSSDGVLRRIQSGDPSWQDEVPPAVARIIKERKFFSHAGSP